MNLRSAVVLLSAALAACVVAEDARPQVPSPIAYATEKISVKDAGITAVELAAVIRDPLFVQEFADEQASLSAEEDTVVIKQTPEVLKQIKGLVELLRKPVVAKTSRLESGLWLDDATTLLEKKVSVDFQDTPLIEAIQQLQKQTDLKLVIDPAFQPDDMPPIILKLSDVSLGAAVKWIARVADCNYALRDRALIFSRSPMQLLELRVYHVGDLLNPQGQEVRFADLVDRISNYVIFALGQDGRCIARHFDRLIVRLDAADHERLEKYLADLRRFLNEVRNVEPDGKPPREPLNSEQVPGHFMHEPEAQSPGEKALRAKLEKKIDFDFQDKLLTEALDFVAKVSKASIVMDPVVIAQGLEKTPITLRVQEMAVEEALGWICRLSELEMSIRDEAVFIFKASRLSNGMDIRMYYVRDLFTIIPPKEWADFLTHAVRPDHWDDDLGTQVLEEKGILTIAQRPEFFEYIDAMLAEIRLHHKEPLLHPERIIARPELDKAAETLKCEIKAEYKDNHLNDVLADLIRQADIRVKVDPNLDRNTLPKVTFSAEKMDLESALKKILQPMKLEFFLFSTNLMIGSTEFLNDAHTECVLYNLSDLTEPQLETMKLEMSRYSIVRETDPDPVICFAGNRLLLNHFLSVHIEIKDKLKAMRARKP